MGSVKDLKVLKSPTADSPGLGRFVFSDRYSVFDWGEMPDHITDKGAAINIVTAYFFEKLEEQGIKTHYRGLIENDKTKKLMDLEKPSNILEIDLVRVVKPRVQDDSYDYSPFQKEQKNLLIPIEVIYRNSLPAGSSIFRRLNSGKLEIQDIGLDEKPTPGQKLPKPIFDVSTKLETTDRYISWQEAQRICNLSDAEQEDIKSLLLEIDNLITIETEKIGLTNEDGKIELAFDENRELMVVDALGTLDESRFTFNGMTFSKEIARQYYRGTKWAEDIERAKQKDRLNWKENVELEPPALPEEFARSISAVYKAYANQLTSRKWFDAPSIEEIMDKINKFI